MDRNEAPTWLEVAGLVGATSVAATALASLLLAWAGAHDGITAVVVGAAVGIALAAVVLRRRRGWTIAAWCWRDAALLGSVVVLAALLFFPGAPYAAKNRDPGVYVNHAVAIANQGSTTLEDPVADTGAELTYEDGEARIVTGEGDVAWRKLPYRAFPTDPERLGEILPDFFHLWPATLATAKDVAGNRGLFNLTPAFALGAVALFFLAVRRAFGPVAATVAAGLLAVNELQVWQAKYPTAEAMSQFLYAAALLAVVLALRTRWRVAAALGGAFVGLGFVALPEGILVVGMAALAVAVLWALRLAPNGHLVAFVAGLAPTLAIGTYQAYGTDSRYVELQEGLPGFGLAVAGFLALVVGAVVLRWLAPKLPSVDGRVVGYALVGLFALFLVVALLRPQLFGESFRVDKQGNRSRGYDELNLRRLMIFVTPLALLAAVGALFLGVREKWDAARWALVLPGVLVAPVLIWEPHIAPDLMWWTRRYAPMVVPTLLILLGVCAAWLWNRRGVWQVATVVVVALVGAYTLRQSSDVYRHREFAGSVEVIDQLDEVLPDDAVVVWQGGGEQSANFAATPFTWLDLPAIAGPPSPSDLDALQEALDGRPLYLVNDDGQEFPTLEEEFEPVAEITGEIDEFEHSFTERPRRARSIPVDLHVYRLRDP